MTLTTAVYVAIVLVAVAITTYWILYTTRLKTRERTMAIKGRPPTSTEEGIAVATIEKEQTGRSGSLS